MDEKAGSVPFRFYENSGFSNISKSEQSMFFKPIFEVIRRVTLDMKTFSFQKASGVEIKNDKPLNFKAGFV